MFHDETATETLKMRIILVDGSGNLLVEFLPDEPLSLRLWFFFLLLPSYFFLLSAKLHNSTSKYRRIRNAKFLMEYGERGRKYFLKCPASVP